MVHTQALSDVRIKMLGRWKSKAYKVDIKYAPEKLSKQIESAVQRLVAINPDTGQCSI